MRNVRSSMPTGRYATFGDEQLCSYRSTMRGSGIGRMNLPPRSL